MSKHTPGPWPRSTIEYQDDLTRIIRRESSHLMDEDTFYVQIRKTSHGLWWDWFPYTKAKYQEPFESLDEARRAIINDINASLTNYI